MITPLNLRIKLQDPRSHSPTPYLEASLKVTSCCTGGPSQEGSRFNVTYLGHPTVPHLDGHRLTACSLAWCWESPWDLWVEWWGDTHLPLPSSPASASTVAAAECVFLQLCLWISRGRSLAGPVLGAANGGVMCSAMFFVCVILMFPAGVFLLFATRPLFCICLAFFSICRWRRKLVIRRLNKERRADALSLSFPHNQHAFCPAFPGRTQLCSGQSRPGNWLATSGISFETQLWTMWGQQSPHPLGDHPQEHCGLPFRAEWGWSLWMVENAFTKNGFKPFLFHGVWGWISNSYNGRMIGGKGDTHDFDSSVMCPLHSPDYVHEKRHGGELLAFIAYHTTSTLLWPVYIPSLQSCPGPHLLIYYLGW